MPVELEANLWFPNVHVCHSSKLEQMAVLNTLGPISGQRLETLQASLKSGVDMPA